jgi:hypothetical protein
MDPDQVVQRNERAIFRELSENEGSVLLHLDSGAYHGLNPIGTLIWNMIGDGATLHDLIEGVRSQLTDPPASLRSDVEAFIDDLAGRDLLTVSGT